jgi:hypothetical protein
MTACDRISISEKAHTFTCSMEEWRGFELSRADVFAVDEHAPTSRSVRRRKGMKLHHHWPTQMTEAIALQSQLRERAICRDLLRPVDRVAGIDVGFEDGGAVARAAVAVLSFPGLELVDSAVAIEKTDFPYVAGLLSFREAPAALNALSKLSVAPDLILRRTPETCDPRRAKST